MELTTRYGLEFNPFLKNSKEILFEGSEYTEAKFRLDYLARTKGFGLLTGAPGRGKTTLVRSWSAGLNPSLYKVIYTSLSTVTVNDFYRNLAVSLGAQASYRKTENFHIIQEEINRLAAAFKVTDIPMGPIEKQKNPDNAHLQGYSGYNVLRTPVFFLRLFAR